MADINDDPTLRRVRWPVEAKVKHATAGAILAAFVVWALQRYVFRGDVPEPVVAVVALAVPAVLTFAAGYLAPHTPRPLSALVARARDASPRPE